MSANWVPHEYMTIPALMQFKDLLHFVRCLKETLQGFKGNEIILRSHPVYTDSKGTIESVPRDKANCP